MRLLNVLTAPWLGWMNAGVQAVLVALKLAGVIAWSWWWVLVPLWLSLAVGTLVAGIALAVLIITAARGGR